MSSAYISSLCLFPFPPLLCAPAEPQFPSALNATSVSLLALPRMTDRHRLNLSMCITLCASPPPPPLPIVFRWVMETRELTVVAGSFVGFQLLFSVASPPLSSAITPGYGRLPPTKLTEWNSRYVTGNAARQQAFSFHLSYLVFLQQRCAIVPLLVVMPAHFKRKGNRLCCITSRIGCNACGKKIMVDDHWWIFCSEDSNFIIWDCNFQWMWVNYLFIFFGRKAWNWFWTEHQYLVGGKWGIAGDFFHFFPPF